MNKLHLDLRPLSVGEVAEFKDRAFDRLRHRAVNTYATPPRPVEDHEILRLCAMVSDLTAPLPHSEMEPVQSPERLARTTTEPVNTGMTHRKVGGDAAGPLSGSTGKGVGFEDVLHVLKTEKYAQAWRTGWNGKHQRIMLQMPNEESKMTEPYIYMIVASPLGGTSRIPWLASQADMLAEDWQWEVLA